MQIPCSREAKSSANICQMFLPISDVGVGERLVWKASVFHHSSFDSDCICRCFWVSISRKYKDVVTSQRTIQCIVTH